MRPLLAGAVGVAWGGWHSVMRHRVPLTEREKFVYSMCAAALVVLAGLMSGLTLGLMSLDTVELEVLLRSGTDKEKLYARRIQPVVKRPHFLLVTLLLCNAAAAEALPIFLDRLANPVTAVLLSITVVLVFGEIVPQAVCARYGLAVGAYSAWFVTALMTVTSPVSWPISKVLDWALGEERTALFRRAQLKALVDLHSTDEGLGGNLTADEIGIIRGALDMSAKTAADCLTPLDKVFSLPTDAVLDTATLERVVASGHSRIPVHEPGEPEAIVGMLLAKELILVDHRAGVRVRDLRLRSLPFLRADTSLYDMLRLFETGRCHMAVLVSPGGTLETAMVRSAQLAEVIKARVDRDAGATGKLAASAAWALGASGPLLVRRSSADALRRKHGRDRPRGSSAEPPAAGLAHNGAPVVNPDSSSGAGNGVRPSEIGAAAPDDGACDAGAPVPAISTPAPPTRSNTFARAMASSSSSGSVSSSSSDVGGEVLGIVTIEDVVEELIQHEIVDETDIYMDNERTRRVNAGQLLKSLPADLRRLLDPAQIAALAKLNIDCHTDPAAAAAAAAAFPPSELRPGSRSLIRGGYPASRELFGGTTRARPADGLASCPPKPSGLRGSPPTRGAPRPASALVQPLLHRPEVQ